LPLKSELTPSRQFVLMSATLGDVSRFEAT